MRYIIKADAPYEWYWQGKPLRKGIIRGEHIMPQPVGITTRRASTRDPSPQAHRHICPRCGCEYEQPRPPTPSNSGVTERNAIHNTRFCACHTVIEDPEPPQTVRRCNCDTCRAATPAASVRHAFVPPTPALSRTVTPGPGPYHHDSATASPHEPMVYCLYCQEYHHVCQHNPVSISNVQQPVEAPAPASTPTPAPAPAPTTRARPAQSRCRCPQCVALAAAAAAAAAEAEAEARRHERQFTDCRFENYVSPNVTDDTASLYSVDMGPRSDRSTEESRSGHLILAIPVEYTE
ncbi:hypothetical protein N7454_008958 [Penicillium verhagenii]|nr:hypothetical protein N7454_008958 [Penicillium verhagenii]